MFDFSLSQLVAPVSLFFDTTGILLVILGGTLAILEWTQVQIRNTKSREKRKNETQDLRIHFAQKMILGLEFFLAGDLMRLIATPTNDVLIRVGAIIVIRTILAYFLSREIETYKKK
jgi:uncharacterized membrane protein